MVRPVGLLVLRLDPEAWAREVLCMWLRRCEGVPRGAFEGATGFSLDELGGDALRQLLAQGWIEEAPGGAVRLASRALFVSDSVLAELI